MPRDQAEVRNARGKNSIHRIQAHRSSSAFEVTAVTDAKLRHYYAPNSCHPERSSSSVKRTAAKSRDLVFLWSQLCAMNTASTSTLCKAPHAVLSTSA